MTDLVQDAGPAEVDQGPSIADSLAAAYDRAQAAPDTSDTEAAPVETQQQTEQRARDEAGRFAKAQAAEQAPAEQKETTTADPAKTEQNAPEKASAPPVSWSAAAKAEWATLSPAIQAEIARREAEVTRGFTEKGEEAKRGAEIFAALEPVKGVLDMSGTPPAQYVRNLVAADQALRTNPGEAIRQIAQMYGISLDQPNATAATAAAPSQEGLPADPHLAALQQEVSTLKGEITRRQQQEAQQADAALQQQIGAFRDEKGPDGQPLRPYFDQVRAHMAAIMQAEGHGDLAKAYESAIWARPDIRASIQAQQAAEAELKRKQEAAKAATEAQRKAGLNLSGRGTTAGTPTTPPSLRDSLSEAFDRATAA